MNTKVAANADSMWQPIETAPDFDRVLVAGWQKPSGSVAGYWWYYEDATDENGKPMDHPEALMWMPWPKPPQSPPPKAATFND